MEPTQDWICVNGHQLCYTQYHGGKEIILAFHGFGQKKEVFQPLAESLIDTSTVFSFDLFFHGNSKWNQKDHALTLDEWGKIIGAFLEKHNINMFSVCGYSMGGRFALATLSQFENRITQVYLIAPDGIFTSIWYKIATGTEYNRKLLRLSILKPKLFNCFLELASKLRLASNKVIRFAEKNMDNRNKRRQVYYSWVVFRLLVLNRKKVIELLGSSNKKVYLLTGKYDNVIPTRKFDYFVGQLPDVEFLVLEAGHSNLLQAVASYLKFKKSS